MPWFSVCEPPVTRYRCGQPLPAHHAIAAQRAGGSPFVKLRENSWFLNFPLATLHLPIIIRQLLSCAVSRPF